MALANTVDRYHERASALALQPLGPVITGGPERGFDNGKKVKGRKRHVLVDTLGLLLIVVRNGLSG